MKTGPASGLGTGASTWLRAGPPRSSRRRYRGLVEDYQRGRLDEALMAARGLYHDMVLRQMESDGQPREALWR